MNSGSSDIALLCIGDELLDGRTRDLNAHYLGARITEIGGRLAEVRVVDDDPQAIVEHVRALAASYPTVVTSGGLGPTLDDRTRFALAEAAGVELTRDVAAAERLRAKFRAMDRPWLEANDRQAWFPFGATIFESNCGTADPFLIDVGDSQVLSLPGVPSEFRLLFDAHGAGFLPTTQGLTRLSLVLYGLGESAIATLLEPDARPGVDTTYKAQSPYVAIGFRGKEPDLVHAAANSARELLRKWIVPGDRQTLAAALGDAARDMGATVATVESCTGGLIASSITDVAGSSGYFWGGWVTYANGAKIDGVGVDPELLARHGAVSAEVATAMATGALERSPATASVSVSGIAGPGGGSAEKPVGLVYMAVVGPMARVVVRAVFAGRGRASFKRHVVALAQLALIESISGRNGALESVSGVEWCRPIE